MTNTALHTCNLKYGTLDQGRIQDMQKGGAEIQKGGPGG